MEKMKKMANWLFLNSVKAFRPKASARDCFSVDLFTGQAGIVSE